MGLRNDIERRWYVLSWRMRYWWLDTPAGVVAQRAVLVLAGLVAAVQILRMLAAATLHHVAGAPQQSVYWWVVQIIIAIVAAAITLAMMPKQPPTKPQEHDVPTTEDGLYVKTYFGENWVGDEFQLAHKDVGHVKIKSKGGKK